MFTLNYIKAHACRPLLSRAHRAARAVRCAFLLLLPPLAILPVLAAAEPRFQRGDANLDTKVDISDAGFTLGYLFLGTWTVRCPDAADANNDGVVNISDPILVLGYLFLGTTPPSLLGVCETDTTPDALADCDVPPDYCSTGAPPEIEIAAVLPAATFPTLRPGERLNLHVALAYRDADADIDTLDVTLRRPDGARTVVREVFRPADAEGTAVRRLVVDSTFAAGRYVFELVLRDMAGSSSTEAALEVDVAAGAPRPLDIAAAEPDFGRPGDTIRIAGLGFVAEDPSANVVTFAGGARAFPVAMSPLELEVIVPDGASTGEITVETPAGVAVSDFAFEVISTITIRPEISRMITGASASFTAAASGTGSNEVRWTVDGLATLPPALGTLVADGVRATYSAPAEPPPAGVVRLRCASVAVPAVAAELAIEIVPPEPGVGEGLVRARTGGTVRSRDGRVAIAIRPAGIAADTSIAVESLDPSTLARRLADHVVVAAARLEAPGIHFLKPADLSLAMRSREPPGAELSLFAIHPTTGDFVDTGRRLTLDAAGLRGSVELDHFSAYAVARRVDELHFTAMEREYTDFLAYWATITGGFRIVVAPDMELLEGLAVPVEVVPEPEAITGPVGPFHPGVIVKIVFSTGDVREVAVPHVQPSADGWRLGLVLPLPVLRDCHGPTAGTDGARLPGQRRFAELRIFYAEDSFYTLRLHIDCLSELELAWPAPISPVPFGLDTRLWESNKVARLDLTGTAAVPVEGPYQFSTLRIAAGSTLGYTWGLSLPLGSCITAPLSIEVTGEAEIAGVLSLAGMAGDAGRDGSGNNDGGDGGFKHWLNSGAGGEGGPRRWEPPSSGAVQLPDDLVCSLADGVTCITPEGARGQWYCHSGYPGYGGATWEKPSKLGLIFEITGALQAIANGDLLSAAEEIYDVYSATTRFLKREENMEASTGSGGYGAYALPATHAELVGLLPARGGGGGGGSGKAFIECGISDIDFCKDKAGGGGGGGGGGACTLRLVVGGTLSIAPTGIIDGSAGRGGNGGNGTDSGAAPGGGGGGGAGAQMIIVTRELTNNGSIRGAGGLAGVSGAYLQDDVTVLVPKGFGTRGPDGVARIQEWHRSAGGDHLPWPFQSVYRGPRIRAGDNLPRGRDRAETVTALEPGLTLKADLGGLLAWSGTFTALGGRIEPALYYHEAIARHGDDPEEISGGVRTHEKPAGGAASTETGWTLREGLNSLDLRVNLETTSIPGADKGPFVELHPWERHYVFWYPGAVDSDHDGVRDGLERTLALDVSLPDTDGDTATDWEEVFWFHSDPRVADPVGAPDLVVSSLSTTPENPRVRQSTVVRGTIRNRSLRAAARASRASVKIVLGTAVTVVDTTWDIPALGPLESFTAEMTVQPEDAGVYTITVVADFDEVVRGEFDERNNTRQLVVRVR